MGREKKQKVDLVSLLIIILGIFNIISGIITIPGHGFIITIITQSIIVFSGLSSILTGFILTIIGLGLYKQLNLAWKIAIFLLIFSIVTNLLEGLNFIGIVFSGILLWALYTRKDKFKKPLGIHLNFRYLIALWIIIFVLLYGIVGAYFLGNQFKPPIQTVIQAFYYTVITASTVGYGDFVPITDQARLFTVSLILFGVGTFLSAIALIVQPLMKEFEKIITKWVDSKDSKR